MPASDDTSARKYQRVRTLIVNHRQFKVAVERCSQSGVAGTLVWWGMQKSKVLGMVERNRWKLLAGFRTEVCESKTPHLTVKIPNQWAGGRGED